MSSSTSPCKRRGFNLIEAAVVLGVVGLVIGGIWAAASAGQFNRKISETVSLTGTVYQNVRKLYQNVDVGPPATPTSIQYDLLRSVLPAGTMLRSDELVFLDPFGYDVSITVMPELIGFQYYYGETGEAYCAALAPRLAATFRRDLHTAFIPSGMDSTGGDVHTPALASQSCKAPVTTSNFILYLNR